MRDWQRNCGGKSASLNYQHGRVIVASREALEEMSGVAPVLRGGIGAGNGAQAGFSTGATRSTSEGKIDFEGHFNPEVLAIFGDYMNRHRIQRDGQLRASDNWQMGIPIYRYTKSLVRHNLEFWRMWRGREVINLDNGQPFTFRDVLCAIMFNTMGLIYEMDRLFIPGGSGKQPLDLTRLDKAHRIDLENIDTKDTP